MIVNKIITYQTLYIKNYKQFNIPLLEIAGDFYFIMATTKKTPIKTPKKTVKKAVKAIKSEEPLLNKEFESFRFNTDPGYVSFQVKRKKDIGFINIHSFNIMVSQISCGVRQMNNLPKSTFFNGNIFNSKLKTEEIIEKFSEEFLKALSNKAKNERFTFVIASDYKNEGNQFMDKICETSSSFKKNRNSPNQIKVWTIKI